MIIDTDMTDQPIDGIPQELPETSGARVVFAGTVRNHDGGKAVQHLEYYAHRQADRFLHMSVENVARQCDDMSGTRHGIDAVYVRHRTGLLHIGDCALLVVVDAAHRGEAFRACADIVDHIKAEVPIWKKQRFEDGTNEWSKVPE